MTQGQRHEKTWLGHAAGAVFTAGAGGLTCSSGAPDTQVQGGHTLPVGQDLSGLWEKCKSQSFFQ